MLAPEISVVSGTFRTPEGHEAASRFRYGSFETERGYTTMCVGHCAVQGQISGNDPDAVFRFQVDSKWINKDSEQETNILFVQGVYRFPEFGRADIIKSIETSGISERLLQHIERLKDASNEYRRQQKLGTNNQGAHKRVAQAICRELIVADLKGGIDVDLLASGKITAPALRMFAAGRLQLQQHNDRILQKIINHTRKPILEEIM